MIDPLAATLEMIRVITVDRCGFKHLDTFLREPGHAHSFINELDETLCAWVITCQGLGLSSRTHTYHYRCAWRITCSARTQLRSPRDARPMCRTHGGVRLAGPPPPCPHG